MKLLVVLLSLMINVSFAQQSFTNIITALEKGNSDSCWSQLVKTKRIPLTEKDSVAFFYRGNATSVKWLGDFNGWGQDKNFNSEGKKIGATDIWMLKCSFPVDARFDYKIILDGNKDILDPENPFQQWSGLGGGTPNSELRMSGWRPEPVSLAQSGPKGTLKKNLLIESKILGYQITYCQYVPHGKTVKVLPVVYVTDGYEFMHEKMGNMVTILDNLIASKKIKPITVVFVDNRDPSNPANNRRMDELALSEKYLRFFVEELVPTVEKGSHVTSENRCIMGISLGGLTAAYFAFSRPDVFGLAGVQSPAFWYRPDIYTLCDKPGKHPEKVFMTTGTFHDTEEGARKMKTILEKNACTFQYKEVPQGHSWGNWKGLIDDALIYFFPVK